MNEQVNENLNKIAEITHMIGVLLGDFKSQAEISATSANENATLLAQTLVATRAEIDQLLTQVGSAIQTETHNAIVNSAKDAFLALETRIDSLCKHIDSSSDQVVNAANMINSRTKLYGWTIMGIVGILSAGVIGFASWHALNKKREINELMAKYQNAEFSDKVKNAVSKVNFTICGDRACVKLDNKATRYGANGEFIIIE